MKNIQNLTIDINKKPFQTITANVGEVASRFIRITILDNNMPVNLTGVNIYLYVQKADGTKVFNSVEKEDKNNGVILAELTSQVLSVEGLAKLTLLLIKDGAKLCSKQFLLNVDSSIVDDEAIESTNEFSALVDAISNINDIGSRFEYAEDKINAIDNLLNNHIHDTVIEINNSEDLINAIKNNNHDTINLKKGTYIIDTAVTVKCKILGNGSTINVTSTITTSGSCKLYDITFIGSNCEIDCINLVGGATIEGCIFSQFHNAIFQTGISVHGLIKRNTFQYNRNGIYLQNSNTNSVNNLTIENNYFVKHGTSADNLSADSTEPTFPQNLDTSAEGTGLNNIIGVGLICKSGCNGVFVHNNVFEYNTYCGVLVYQCNGRKTNDVKITNNYFEGNKTTGIALVNGSNIGELMQTDIHDNFYARINGKNSDFYSYDIKAIGKFNSPNKVTTMFGYKPCWHPISAETQSVVGFSVKKEGVREYYDLIAGTSKQYFQIPSGTYHQPEGVSYMPTLYVLEYKVKLNKALRFCDGSKTTNAVMKSFEAGEYARFEIVPGLLNYVQYIDRPLGNDEYFRIYQFYPLSMK